LWRDRDFDNTPAPLPAGFDCKVESENAEDEGSVAGGEAEGNAGAKKKGGASTALRRYAVKVGVVRDPRGRFSLYRIRLNATVRDLPEDLVLLSTEDDSDPANAGKTYKLTTLLTALAGVHLKRYLAGTVSPAIYLTMRND
jgi:hypothetical protein